MTNRKLLLRLADSFLVALLMVLIASSDWLNDFDYKISDNFYQQLGEKSSDIVVIGIDQNTLNHLGPKSSIRRADIAKVIDQLNGDPATRPAVIGLDIIFTGENAADPEGDKILVNAAAKYGNVVVASEVDLDDENISAPWDETWTWIPPFSALAAVADTGHINAPNEEIVRHDLLYVNATERGRLYSFGRVIYEKWCSFKGIEPNAPPKTAGNGIYYLSFTAKSYAGKNNFWDLLEGKVPPEVYRGKMVLIGLYAPGMQDSFPTALDRSDLMYGIDIHANAIQAFQQSNFLYEADQKPQLVILFVVSFFTEFFFRNRKMQYIVIGWLVSCLSWFALCQIFRSQGMVLHVSWIPLAVTVIFIGAVATNYILAREEKEQVTNIFGRYVDPTIMNQLLKGDSKSLGLNGELRDIAVLFVDIRGFTSMSEELPPTTVVEILNRYLTLTTECVRKHHGTLDKFVGDCTMAFWNAPIKQENPVLLACRAAIDMIKNSQALEKELKERYGRKISFGVGIHWGSAVVGNIGTPFRMDYTAIGDTVNTAARLEANATGGTILISRVVADILGSRADVVSLGNTIKLKGKSADFEVLKLNSLREMEGQ